MQSNWKLFSIFGIDIELHITFILFILLFVFLDVDFLLILLLLFTSITLHELSHSLVAKHNGIKVKRIVLLPIGGMAAMDEAQLKPYPEFKMAIAGPLFNYVLCIAIALAVQALNLPFMVSWSDWNLVLEGTLSVPLATLLVSSTFWLNWLLGTFNLFLPAIPLDGGRVFRSALAMVTDYVNATRIATTVSTVISLFLFLYSLITFNIILLIIAVFVYFGAVSELDYALSNKLLAHFPLSKLIRKRYLVLPPETKLDTALAEMIASHTLVIFTKTGKSMELVSLYDIRRVPKSKWKATPLSSIARKLRPVRPSDPIPKVLRLMAKSGVEALPVRGKRGLAGVIFRDDISHVFEVLKMSNT